MSNPLDVLLPSVPADPGVSLRWGVVTGVSPLRVRLDTDTTPLPSTPDSIVTGLTVTARVLCALHDRRVTVLGKAA